MSKGPIAGLLAILLTLPVILSRHEQATTAETGSGARAYEQRCATCHGEAAALARSELTLRDGRLIVKDTGEEIGALLRRHGRAVASEAEGIAALLGQLVAAPDR